MLNNLFNKEVMFIRLKKSTFWLCIAVALSIGYMGGSTIHVNSDGREVKFPKWTPVSTVQYKNYKFTHIDYLQPQYINTIINEEMLAQVKKDVQAGLITVANPSLGINIGDGLKFTVDNHIWFLMSAKDESHRFEDIKGE